MAELVDRVGIGAQIRQVQDVFGTLFNAGSEFARDGSQFDHLFAHQVEVEVTGPIITRGFTRCEARLACDGALIISVGASPRPDTLLPQSGISVVRALVVQADDPVRASLGLARTFSPFAIRGEPAGLLCHVDGFDICVISPAAVQERYGILAEPGRTQCVAVVANRLRS